MKSPDDQIIEEVVQAFSRSCDSPKLAGGLLWRCTRWEGHPGRCRSYEDSEGNYIEWWDEWHADEKRRPPKGLEDYIWVTTNRRKHRLIKASHYHGSNGIFIRGGSHQ